MMESKKEVMHTPEPWRFRINGVASSHFEAEICDSRGIYTAYTFNPEDARRIVACVNACAGMSDDELKALPESRSGFWGRMAAVNTIKKISAEAQRDELLAAIEGYLPYMPNSTAKNGGACGHSEMLKASDRLKDAFAKCEVQS